MNFICTHNGVIVGYVKELYMSEIKLRVSDELKDQLKLIAKNEFRSLNKLIEVELIAFADNYLSERNIDKKLIREDMRK